MSNIVEQQEVDLEEGDELATLEETQESNPEPEKPKVAIPDKFKDKSLEDIVSAYENLEKEFGRKNNEYGELRKLTDQMLQLDLEKKVKQEQPAKKAIDVDYLLDNPEVAINTAIESNPRLKALEDKLLNAERGSAKKQFEAKHSDWNEIVNSQNFQGWIQSSKVRQEMFQRAHTNYEYDVADDLFSMYKQVNGIAKAESAKDTSKKLKQASTETGSTGTVKRKIYRRADLINLRINDPVKYEAMEDDIMRAYSEGRVK